MKTIPPTSAQLRAIANQCKYPGTDSSTPSTIGEASSQIGSNIEAIDSFLQHKRPYLKTMRLIHDLERKLGYIGQTNSYAVGAPQNEFDARKLVEELKERCREKREQERRAQQG